MIYQVCKYLHHPSSINQVSHLTRNMQHASGRRRYQTYFTFKRRKEEKASNESNTGEFEPIQLPAFDLSTKKIEYRNGKRRVTTTVFEVKCHLDDALILKHLFCRLLESDDKVPSNSHIYFVAYVLPQYISSEFYRSQITKQNTFLQ